MLTEIVELQRRVAAVLVVPVRPGIALFHGDVACLVAQSAIRLPVVSLAILARAAAATLRSPWRVLGALAEVISGSRTRRSLLGNLVAFPKAVYAAGLVRAFGAHHVHAHWASVPATMALVVSRLTGVPWSFTAHRWDITENNLLRAKVRASSFVRAISIGGRQRILRIIGEDAWPTLHTIHVGTQVPDSAAARPHPLRNTDPFVIACIANLLEVKGHRYLIEACALLRGRGHRFICHLVGDGPLRKSLAQLVSRYRLGDCVRLRGPLPHAAVLAMLARREIDLVVLPSVQTADGAHEGIPVALMEALAHRVPVISTKTGEIPELLGDGAGLLVPPADPAALADAIELVLVGRDHIARVVETGFERVSTSFNIRTAMDRLVRLMEDTRSASLAGSDRNHG